jgi:polyhydroxyalkanoate synthase
LGHSLGGTLATLFAALFPKMVRGLVLLGAPLHFGADAGSLDLWLAATAMVRRGTRRPGEVAGSALAGGSLLADPLSFGWQRWWDEAVSFGDPDRHRVCLAVERWALDELPMPRPFFDDILESFYSRDAFLRGTLSIDGRTAGPDRVQSPLLAVVDPRCRLVPPAAVLPFLRAAIHAEIAVIEYVREAGVALHHVGMLVGREAHRTLWPKILDWLARLDPEHRAVNAGKPGST